VKQHRPLENTDTMCGAPTGNGSRPVPPRATDEQGYSQVDAPPVNGADGASGDGGGRKSSRLGSKARPVIQVEGGSLSTNTDDAEKYLIKANVEIYRRGQKLVRPVIDEMPARSGGKTQSVALIEVTEAHLRDQLGKHIIWSKQNERKVRIVNAPREVAQILLARAGSWKFRPVVGVISTATMRSNGTILVRPGYDEETGLILIAPPEMADIPSHPTKDDAQAALDLLLGLLCEFPFVDEISRSVALSAMLTPAVRAAMSVAPLHAFTSPTPGSGKSYLVDIVSSIYSGKPCPVIGKGETNSELEKRLHTSLVAGHPIVNIDNVNGELGGDFLCQAIERPEIDIRILGETRHARVQNNVTLFATGNNIRLTGDVTRRSMLCRLDAKLERPEQRRFSTDPVDKVLADRGAYIAAALTIARAYRCAGSPLADSAVPIGSFQGWSEFVRSPLMWLGLADPLKSMEEVRSIDPELEQLKVMFAALSSRFGYGPDKAQTAAQILTAAYKGPADSALRDAIDALKQKGRPVDAVHLGKWLARYQDRVVQSMRLSKRDRGKRGAEWFIEDLSKQ
jgi:hypothetical protein